MPSNLRTLLYIIYRFQAKNSCEICTYTPIMPVSSESPSAIALFAIPKVLLNASNSN